MTVYGLDAPNEQSLVRLRPDGSTETLMTASQKVGEKMYAEAGAAAGGAPGGQPSGGTAAADDNVVDAEFKEVKK